MFQEEESGLFGIDANTIPYMRISLRNSLVALFSTSMGYFLFTSNLRRGVLVGALSFTGTYFGTSLYLGFRDYNRYLSTVQKLKTMKYCILRVPYNLMTQTDSNTRVIYL
uniref:Uncharacterized protein LOC111131424 n=1 Tax=Crassostrea virginica TaxID=6565 RepID=A0A8B8E5L0_CRAVI|nr:uncharacterized protein LOC111131424 [Crassostrea virginica]